jgi:uncharacterized protein YbjT (DUF2867 family)
MRVMITGGRGTLGRLLVPRLQKAGHEVVITSRSNGPAPPGTERRRLDLARPQLPPGILNGINTIVHAASNPARPVKVDVGGTALLVQAAAQSGIQHLIYPSIVGVDDHAFFYYRAKRAAERRIEDGEVPHTIVRATQFHEFLDRIFSTGPFITVFPGFSFQVIDGGVVADRLVELVAAGPQGRVADLGGPYPEQMRRMATTWKQAAASRRPVVPVLVVGRTARAFRQNRHHTPNRANGTREWDAWLNTRYRPTE